jgi:hypothetical protein
MLVFSIFSGSNETKLICPKKIFSNGWMQLAVSFTDTELSIFVNSVLFCQHSSFVIPPNVVRKSNFIGRSNSDSDSLINAKIYDFRIYNIGLTSNDIFNDFISTSKSTLISYILNTDFYSCNILKILYFDNNSILYFKKFFK